jgi:hypothetical protein
MCIENDKEITYIKRAEEFLSEYTVSRKLLEMNDYEKKYFGKAEKTFDFEGRALNLPGSEPELRMKMFAIRRFVLSLGNCNEKLFLFYHYIHGESVERCAELIKISRRSAFRLKKRALAFAGRKLETYLVKEKDGVKE